MLNNPFFMEVSQCAGKSRTLELIPIYREENGRFIATRDYRIYAGYAPDLDDQTNGESLRHQYFDNLELMGNDNPCYLGELHFNGLAYFEWKYAGDRLSAREVWQIVDLLQNCVRTYIKL